jgi:hypothetical protein
VAIELRRRVAKSRFFFVMFEALDRRVAFTPSFPEPWFDITRGRSLNDRAGEVLSDFFRKRERDDEDEFVPPEQFSLKGSAWIHPHDVEINPAPALAKPDDLFRMLLEDLVHHAAYLRTLADCVTGTAPEQAVLYLRAGNAGDTFWVQRPAKNLTLLLFDAALGLEATALTEGAILVKGVAALPLARLEHGTHLCCPEHGGVVPVQVMVWPVPVVTPSRGRCLKRINKSGAIGNDCCKPVRRRWTPIRFAWSRWCASIRRTARWWTCAPGRCMQPIASTGYWRRCRCRRNLRSDRDEARASGVCMELNLAPGRGLAGPDGVCKANAPRIGSS